MTEPVLDLFSGCGSRLRSIPARRRSPVHPYTQELAACLRDIYGDNSLVKIEWHAMLREEVRHRRRDYPRRSRMYCPVIDVAVGPFATHQRHVRDYDRLTRDYEGFLFRILSAHAQNLNDFGSIYPAQTFYDLCSGNRNARCFLAIEIEKGNPDLKYLMGSMINASALGRIGILVAWNPYRLRSLLRVRENFLYMSELGKNTFDTTNLLFLDKDQLTDALGRFAGNPPYSTWT
jgi:hypothetical protein